MSLKVLNLGAATMHRLGFPFGKLDEAHLLDAARRGTGLDDWGGEHFLEPMRVMLANANRSGLTALARISTRDIGIHCLMNRLRLTDYLKRYPHVNEQTVERPVFILGFPRTGTTILQNLLALDPKRRALPFWEIMNPVPLLDDPVKDEKVRIRAANRKLGVAYWVVPEMEFVHEIRAESHEECWPLLANGFTVMAWDMSSGWTEYGEWLLEHDMVSSYREYRQCLQVMAQRQPEADFVLKCPDHLWFVEALLEVFPDACIVWTHRDPVASIASYCSLISLNWRMMYGKFDPLEVGRHIERRFLGGIERAMAVRDRVGPSRFFDVDFDQLCKNPKGVVKDITRHFDLNEISDESVDAHLNTKRADARGRHVYSAERYGIDTARVHERYHDYIERFSIPVKQP